MNSTVVTKVMSGDKVIQRYFRGVFAMNDFLRYSPEILDVNDKNVFVINSEYSTVTVGHWLLMFFDGSNPEDRHVCYFDSFARPIGFYDEDCSDYFSTLATLVENSESSSFRMSY